ncbi:hypothetical protein OESDEN_20073 [Oesophagostomum dentatum]|uniref:SXP/RAL-2 family protein Ani s 5-like cation-binding domain-containing protein n=1 Tax=Oesophagostomum dentatum TaxID=61180 RepID=A0A0B1SAL7_OESDE|nr:hypothetical protein OESDEN_20073 [Oesophagostomum dentatum]
MRSLLLVLFSTAMLSYATGQREGPDELRGLPPHLQFLPADIRSQIEAIHQNSALTGEQKKEQIHQIMASLPDSVLDSLPKPPGWERLPQATRDELDRIRKDRTLTHEQRHEKMKAVFDQLPEDLRPPRPPHGGPPHQ